MEDVLEPDDRQEECPQCFALVSLPEEIERDGLVHCHGCETALEWDGERLVLS